MRDLSNVAQIRSDYLKPIIEVHGRRQWNIVEILQYCREYIYHPSDSGAFRPDFDPDKEEYHSKSPGRLFFCSQAPIVVWPRQSAVDYSHTRSESYTSDQEYDWG